MRTYTKIEDSTCDECGDYADWIEVEIIKGIRGVRLLCDECKEKVS